jgi:hypothetical protein
MKDMKHTAESIERQIAVERLDDNMKLVADRDRLLALNKEMREVLQSAQELRPKLLAQYQAVPECVLGFCNRARAILAKCHE